MNDTQEPIEEPTYQRGQFKLPPVVERRFVTQFAITRDTFDKRAIPIMEEIQNAGGFGPMHMKELWDFHLKIIGTTPRPKGRLTHIPRLVRAATNERAQTVLELTPPLDDGPAFISITQGHTDTSKTRFEDIEHECQRWLPQLLERFEVKALLGLKLDYRNVIQRERYPAFWEGDEKLLLGKLLWLFQNNPVAGSYVTPFSVEFNESTKLGKDTHLRFAMKTISEKHNQLGLEFSLGFSSLLRKKALSISELWVELGESHELIFQNFIRYFSKEALEEFTS